MGRSPYKLESVSELISVMDRVIQITHVTTFNQGSCKTISERFRRSDGRGTNSFVVGGAWRANFAERRERLGKIYPVESDCGNRSRGRRGDRSERARSLGYVFQNFNLLNGYTSLENVELGMSFGSGVDRSYAKNLLDRVGLGNRQSYRPEELSQGQKQRVAVARALANRPKLVLADEPTGNLDPKNANLSLELIQSLCSENGAALILVSHDPDLDDRFERTLELAELNQAGMAREEGRSA